MHFFDVNSSCQTVIWLKNLKRGLKVVKLKDKKSNFAKSFRVISCQT